MTRRPRSQLRRQQPRPTRRPDDDRVVFGEPAPKKQIRRRGPWARLLDQFRGERRERREGEQP